VQQGVKRGAQPPAHRGRDPDQFVRQFVERVTQAIAQACPRKSHSPGLRGRPMRL
jgi:hypothetical protein